MVADGMEVCLHVIGESENQRIRDEDPPLGYPVTHA